MTKLQLISILLLLTINNYGQELKINNFKPDNLDISARESRVTDVNGDICSLIKVRTGLSNVRFFSNLSIEKVEKHQGEYWIWVSPGTTELKIAVEDFPLLEFDLPLVTEPGTVYIILLVAIFPEKVVYRDTIQPFINFATNPSGAQVYINGYFQGVTPLKINIPDSIYHYEIRKKSYSPVSGNDTLDQSFKTYNFDLDFNPKAKRFYATAGYGINTYFHSQNYGTKNIITSVYGFQFGKLGGIGYYGSIHFSYLNTKIEFETITDIEITNSEVFIPNENLAGNTYTYNPGIDLPENDRFGLLRISLGINLQLAKQVFTNIGVGYSHSKFYPAIVKNPWDDGYGEWGSPGPGSEIVYTYVLDKSFWGPHINAGLILRFANKFLLTINSTHNYIYKSFAQKLINHGGGQLNYHYSDFTLGLGYNF